MRASDRLSLVCVLFVPCYSQHKKVVRGMRLHLLPLLALLPFVVGGPGGPSVDFTLVFVVLGVIVVLCVVACVVLCVCVNTKCWFV